MMKRCFSGISIIVLLMIVLSSIIQFHHHDKTGRIIFAITTICCNETNDHNHEHSEIFLGCCHCEHHEHNNHDCGSKEDCSAHLGDFQATKQTSLIIDSHPTLLLCAIFYEPEINTLNQYYGTESCFFDTTPPITKGAISPNGLRAPPYC